MLNECRRIHALYYDKSRLVIGTVAFILIAETGTNIYLLIGASRKSSGNSCSNHLPISSLSLQPFSTYNLSSVVSSMFAFGGYLIS